jgi:hypothetical protein
VSSRRCLAPLLLSAAVGAAAALPSAALQRSDLRLAGSVIHGSVDGGRALLLVGGDDKAPRRLVELRLAADGAKLATVAADLPPTVDAVMSVPGATMVLLRDVAPEGGRLLAIDPAQPASRHAVAGIAGLLLGVGERGEVAPPPPWLAVGRAGEARRLLLEGDTLRAGEPHGLPVTASLERWGLRLESPAARFAGPWLAIGPQQEGVVLRSVLIASGGERREHTSALPEPERVADSAVVTLDGRPTLVVGTFRGLGVMSRKRLRVFALAGEPGAPPRRPLLARELSARAWQEIVVRAGDFDGDGKDDLAVAAAEGLGGGEVTVTVFRGMGGGRLRAEPVQARVEVKDVAWRYGADVDGDRRPDLVTLGGGKLQVFSGSAPHGLPAKKPSVAVKVEGTEASSRRVTEVLIGPRGTTGREILEPAPTARPGGGVASPPPPPSPTPLPDPQQTGRAEWQLVDLDGDDRSELLWWALQPDGDTKVIVLRF